MAKKIIIDTDPAMGTKGGDPEDCFAIMLAMNSPEVEILGITTVQGNVPVERGYSNASYLVEHLKRDIPVHTGRPGTYDKIRNEKVSKSCFRFKKQNHGRFKIKKKWNKLLIFNKIEQSKN